MTSAGAISRHTGSRSEKGLPAARTVVRLRDVLDIATAPALRERLLRRTGLDRSLTICPDLSSALAVQRHEPAKAVPSTQILDA